MVVQAETCSKFKQINKFIDTGCESNISVCNDNNICSPDSPLSFLRETYVCIVENMGELMIVLQAETCSVLTNTVVLISP